MSVQDDANTVRKTGPVNSLARAALWAVLAGALAVTLFPAAWLPYHTRLELRSATPPFSADERVALRRSGVRIDQRRGRGDSWQLEARASSAEQAEGALAEAASRALVRGDATPASTAALPGPMPDASLPRAAQAAAWLLAEASALEHAVSALGPAPVVALPAPSPAQDRRRAILGMLDDDHAAAVRALDTGRLAQLARVMPAAEMAWARQVGRGAGEAGSLAPDVERALLRVRWLQRTGRDRRTAELLLERRSADERARVDAAAATFGPALRGALRLEREAAVSPWIPPARRPLAPRVAAGAIAASLVLVILRMLGYRRRTVARMLEPAGEPFAFDAFATHWVSARSARAAALAALRLVGRGLERSERVLLIDAGARTRLHQPLERNGRWGLAECVRDRLPVLGLVQDGGTPGLFLLARGEGRTMPPWREVARVVSGTRTHFDRTIICVEPKQMREAGRLLSADGFGWWWGRARVNEQRPAWLVEAMDNSCNDIEVPSSVELSRDMPAAAARPLPETPTPAPVEFAAPLQESLVSEAALDCDLQVGERLRFLAWVRQLHEELPSATPDRPPAEEDAVTSR